MKKILFVCTGNICRSPTAEAVMRHKAELSGMGKDIIADSAAMYSYHVGDTPDKRAIATAKMRGISMDGIYARKINKRDFADFDLILGMDRTHLREMRSIVPAAHEHKVALFLEYADSTEAKEVPDPYYGSQADFDYALDLIEAGVDGILEQISIDTKTL